MRTIDQDEIQRLFEYRDGCLFRRIAVGRAKAGSRAGLAVSNVGYHVVGIHGKVYLIHRLVFLYHHGYLPKYVDHINRDRKDNRIENLRACTQSENSLNRVATSASKSGHRGIFWAKTSKKWCAQLMINYRTVFSRTFESLDEAIIALQNEKEFWKVT